MFRPGWLHTLNEEIGKRDWPLPKDYRKFNLTRGQYIKTGELRRVFIRMAYWESGYDETKEYAEAFRDSKGKRVISTGLFQLSVESLRGYGIYSTQVQLKDPHFNIKCAVKVFHFWLMRDSVISRKRWWFFGAWQGPARYWSVLRGERAYTKRALKDIQRANK